MEEVRIWEEDVVIPTYEIGAAEKTRSSLKTCISGKLRESLSLSGN